jgi:hypothetical protein
MFPMGPGSRRLLNQSTYEPYGDARIAARPPEGGYFQILHVAPLPLAVDQFGFVNTVYRLGEGLVVAVTNAADRWVDASFGQSPYVSTIALCIDNRPMYRQSPYVSTIALCIEWTDIARPAARQWFAKQTMRGAIRVMHPSALLNRPSIVQGLFQRIEDKVCLGRP